jgi:uncharacterized membrane protein
MVKMIVAFISLFIIFFCGIDIFRKLTRKAKWELTKLASYSIVCSLLATAVAVLFVFIF